MNRTFDKVRHWLQYPWANGKNGHPIFLEVPAPSDSARILAAAGIPAHLIYPHTTLAHLLDQSAARFPDAAAIAYEDRTWTYAQLLQWSNRIAGGLANLGIRRRDRVLVSLPNCPEFVAVFFAIQKLGAVVVNAGPLMGTDDLRKTIAITTPSAVIGLDLRAASLLEAAGDPHDILHWIWISLSGYQAPLTRLGYQYKLWTTRNSNGHGDKSTHTSLDAFLATAPARPPTLPAELDDTALLQPTGGTTGTLKLAELSHRALISNATQVATCMRCAQGQERILALLPLFHVYALTTCLLTGIISAAKIILLTRFNPRQTLATIMQHQPTIFPLVPMICDKLSDELERTHQRLPPELRICLSGAAPLPPKIADRFEQLSGVELTEGYGLTEAGPVTHANLTGHRRMGSIGIPLPDTRTRIVDLDGTDHDVPIGQPGEMLISGPQLMSRYCANPEQTSRALTTDAAGTTWLRTGDIVKVNADGYFYVVDRKKDMIIRSGLKVYPARVEEVLKSCEGVADCAVFGRPDHTHTEMVVAVIAPVAGVDFAQLRARLTEIARKHLAPYEVPTVIEQVAIIPRTPLGKVLKTALRAQPAVREPKEKEVA